MNKGYKKKHGTYMRLKIASEFINEGGESRICQKYGITPPTLYTYVRMFNSDYLSFVGFFSTIMGELWENGYHQSAQFLRNNAVQIFSKNVGKLPPIELDMQFPDVIPQQEKQEFDDITKPLRVFDELIKAKKG